MHQSKFTAKIKREIGHSGTSRVFQQPHKGLFWMLIQEFGLQSRASHLGPVLGVTGPARVTHSLAAQQQMPRKEFGSKARI